MYKIFSLFLLFSVVCTTAFMSEEEPRRQEATAEEFATFLTETQGYEYQESATVSRPRRLLIATEVTDIAEKLRCMIERIIANIMEHDTDFSYDEEVRAYPNQLNEYIFNDPILSKHARGAVAELTLLIDREGIREGERQQEILLPQLNEKEWRAFFKSRVSEEDREEVLKIMHSACHRGFISSDHCILRETLNRGLFIVGYTGRQSSLSRFFLEINNTIYNWLETRAKEVMARDEDKLYRFCNKWDQIVYIGLMHILAIECAKNILKKQRVIIS